MSPTPQGHLRKATTEGMKNERNEHVLDAGDVMSGTTMTMEGVTEAWERTVTRGDDLYAARPVRNNPSLCEIGRFTRHEWRDGDGGVLETWDPVGTATAPMPAHVSDWWLADTGKDRLGRLLTEKDVRMMVYRVDERLRPHLDPDDLEEGEPVYHLGDWGYVRAKDYEAAFEGEPDWASDMYMLDGNEPERDGHWADVYNRGGLKALGEELNRMFDEDRAEYVFYTTAEAPAEGFTLPDPADPTGIAIGGTDGNGFTL